MSNDTYQAVFDAVRSRLSNGDIGASVESAIRAENFSHFVQQAASAWQLAGYEQSRPSVMFKPKLSKDGNEWCVLLGENLQEGCVAFGKTPYEAMLNFDSAWVSEGGTKA